MTRHIGNGVAIVGFNYDSLEGNSREAVEQHTKAIHTILRRTATDIIEIGRRLICVRDEISGYYWQAWLHAEFRWSVRSARRFIQVAEKFGDVPSETLNNFRPSGLYELVTTTVPEAAVEEAVEMARAGEEITERKAIELIRQHRPESTRAKVVRDAAARLREFVCNLARRMTDDERRLLSEQLTALATEFAPEVASAHKKNGRARPNRRVRR